MGKWVLVLLMMVLLMIRFEINGIRGVGVDFQKTITIFPGS